MTIELIQAIGEHIVVPICILIGVIAWLYFLTR
jgi:hypothetical protein